MKIECLSCGRHLLETDHDMFVDHPLIGSWIDVGIECKFCQTITQFNIINKIQPESMVESLAKYFAKELENRDLKEPEKKRLYSTKVIFDPENYGVVGLNTYQNERRKTMAEGKSNETLVSFESGHYKKVTGTWKGDSVWTHFKKEKGGMVHVNKEKVEYMETFGPGESPADPAKHDD